MLSTATTTIRLPLPPPPALTTWEAGLFLCRGGWLGREELSSVRTVDVSRRNRILRVERSDGSGWLLKQGFDPEGAVAVKREAALYRTLAAHGAAWIPRLLGWRPERGLLVLELLSGVRTAREAGPLGGFLSPGIAAGLGRLLAELHAFPSAGIAPAERPAAVGLLAPGAELLWRGSAATLDLARRVQASKTWRTVIDRVDRAWRASALVHLDLRPDNVLLPVDPAGGAGVRIVDWESAGAGDPRWDVGAVVAEQLASWLDGLPELPDVAIERLAPHGAVPRAVVPSAVRALLEGYGPRAGEPEALAPWVGMAFLQLALGRVQDAWVPPPSAERLLEVGEDFVARPREAVARWLTAAA